MISMEARYDNQGKIIRVWDIGQIRTLNDAKVIVTGDTLAHGSMRLRVTWIGTDDRYYPHEVVWCGVITAGDNPYGLRDRQVIAWGPRGMAETFPSYKEGKYRHLPSKEPAQLAETTI